MDIATFFLSLWLALVPSAQAATALTATQTSIVYGSDDCYAFDPDSRYVITSDLPHTTGYIGTTPINSFQSGVSGSGSVVIGTSNNNNSTITAGTGATSGGYAVIFSGSNDTALDGLAFGTSRQCLKWRSAPTNTSLVQRMEIIGFGSSGVNGTGYATGGASSCVCFRIDVTTTNTNIFAVTKNAAVETATDTGILQTLDGMNVFEIIGTSTSVTFFIDGAAVATHATNIPTAVVSPLWTSRTKENVAKGTQLDWVKYSRPRS